LDFEILRFEEIFTIKYLLEFLIYGRLSLFIIWYTYFNKNNDIKNINLNIFLINMGLVLISYPLYMFRIPFVFEISIVCILSLLIFKIYHIKLNKKIYIKNLIAICGLYLITDAYIGIPVINTFKINTGDLELLEAFIISIIPRLLQLSILYLKYKIFRGDVNEKFYRKQNS
jgi:hypothetical protein